MVDEFTIIQERIVHHYNLALRRVRGISFAENVIVDDLSALFCPINFEYDGTTDPWDHICLFENTILLHHYSDGVKCRVFATTLTKGVFDSS